MNFKNWKIAAESSAGAQGTTAGLPAFVRTILEGRGITGETAVKDFLDCHYPLGDPMLLADMDRAVERIRKAMADFEKILIFGDYDCDGITATVLLYDYLENAGADVLYYIPERETEGYGLNKSAIDRVKDAGVKLIITVDNGVTALEEVAYAASLGVDVVVTDHHQPKPELPLAVAVVDPHRGDSEYPFRDLCGAGVAFKLACALEGDSEGMLLEHYSDILAVGILADVVPLLGENRFLVKTGLAQLAQTENLGLLALAAQGGLDLAKENSEIVTFGIAPRINVTGRIGSVDKAVELLLCDDEERAAKLAKEIDELNTERKTIEADIVREIGQTLSDHPELLNRRVLVVSGKGWNPGVIGITASRLVERYGKPCVILSVSGEEARGSARSVEGFSIIDAIRSCSALLQKHGGHPMAAGLSMKAAAIPEFMDALEDYARIHHPVMPVDTLSVDAVISARDITLENIRVLEGLAPFGCCNPQPVLALLDVRVDSITPMGGGKHLRLGLSQENTPFQAVLFGVGPQGFPCGVGERVDCAVSLSVNCYNNLERPSVRIVGLRPAGFDMSGKLRLGAAYECLCRHESPVNCTGEEVAFSREDLSVVFRYLRANTPFALGKDMLYHRLGTSVNYCKLLAALDVLRELELITVKPENGVMVITVVPSAQKAELTASATYRLLQQGMVN